MKNRQDLRIPLVGAVSNRTDPIVVRDFIVKDTGFNAILRKS